MTKICTPVISSSETACRREAAIRSGIAGSKKAASAKRIAFNTADHHKAAVRKRLATPSSFGTPSRQETHTIG